MTRILVLPADSHVPPSLMEDAVAECALRGTHIAVLVPAVLPPTLPISAFPPRIAARLTALVEATRAAMERHGVRGRVAIAPCRSVAALLQSAGRTDTLVLVGRPGWSLRRAAHGMTAELVTVAAPSARRPARSAPRRPRTVEEL